MTPLVKALVIYVGLAKAQVYAPIFTEAGKKYGLDPMLIAAVAYKETRMRNGACFKGAHGVMQIQLKGKSCKKSMKEAKRRKLYDLKTNIFLGAKLMRFWKGHWRRHHLSSGWHWLLHYNQGRGRCPRVHGRRRRCTEAERKVITSGKIGGYADRVLRIHKRMCMGSLA